MLLGVAGGVVGVEFSLVGQFQFDLFAAIVDLLFGQAAGATEVIEQGAGKIDPVSVVADQLV